MMKFYGLLKTSTSDVAGHRQVIAWFLEITFIPEHVCVCLCVCLCVCVRVRVRVSPPLGYEKPFT